MNDRAQFDDGKSHLLGAFLVGVVILGIVIDEMFTRLPPAGSGEVTDICLGVCGCGACPTWWYAAAVTLLGLVLLPIGVAYWRGDRE